MNPALTSPRPSALRVLASIALLLQATAPPAEAALRLWTGAGPNALWSTAANWNPAGPPQNGDDLSFVAGFPRQTSTNDLVGRAFHSFIFNGAGADYTLFGNAVTLSAGVNTLGTARGSLNFSLVTLTADQSFIGDGSQFNISSDVALNGHTLTLRSTTSNSMVSVVGSISGVGDVVKLGVGESLFGGPEGNTFQGTTYVTEGILKLGKGSFGNRLAIPGDLEIGSQVGDDDPFLFGRVVMLRANMITNTGTITINHGSINQNGFDQTIGPLRLYDGGINTSNATLIPTATISQPPWPFTRYPFISGHISLPSDITLDLRQPGPLSIGAVVSGNGGIIQRGYGSLKLRNTNTFTGPVTVEGGLLWIEDSTQALGLHPVVTLDDEGILGLHNVTIANKTLTLNSPGTGLIAILDPCAWTGPINLNFTGQAQVTAGFTFGNDAATSLRLAGPIHGTGGLKFGGHSVELTGNNDFTGNVTAACELLRLNTGALRPFTGSLEVGGAFNSWGSHYGRIDRRDTNALCEVRWMNTAFQYVPRAVIRTNGWANLNGRDIQFGDLDMTGGRITSGAGTLILSGPATNHPAPMTASIEGLVRFSTFPSVRFDVADGPAEPDLRITAAISDVVESGIEKTGAGEMLLTAANTYRNATTVRGGALHIQNAAALGTAGPGTSVGYGATLHVENAPALAEPLTLAGPGRGGTSGALFLGPATGVGANIFLAADTTIRNDASFAILSGVISGPGGLTKIGAGALQLGGGSGAANTYGGDTVVLAGEMVLSKGAGVTTIPGHVFVGGGGGFLGTAATLRQFAGNTIVGSVTVDRGGLWDLGGFSEGFVVANLQGRPPLTLNSGGDVQTGAGTLFLPPGGDVVVNPGSSVLAGSFISGNLALEPGLHRFVVGSGPSGIGIDTLELDVSAAISQTSATADIVKEGSGEMRLSGNNSFTGPVTVNQGRVTAAHARALGTAAGGTFVNNDASLALAGGITVSDESLTLDSTSADALLSLGPVTNVWSGNILLQRTAGIRVADASGALTHSGLPGLGTPAPSISGPGGFNKSGPGAFFVGPGGGNSYLGITTVSDGLLEALRGRSLSSNIVVTGGNAVLRTGLAGLPIFAARTVLPVGASVAVENGGLWAMNGTNFETIDRLVGDGRLIVSTAGALTLSNSVSCTFSGAVSGSGALNKHGLATLHLTGSSPGYTGPATVFNGDYKVDGDFNFSPVTVKAGGQLRGKGFVGNVTVETSGVLRVDGEGPGRRGGELAMSSVNFQNNGVLALAFYGPHPTGGNDRLFVNTAVTLSSPTLSAGFAYAPREGDVITLINKNGAGAVSGALGGFPQGALRTLGDIPVVASYVGGNGNDVTLTVTNLPLRSGGAQFVSGHGGTNLVPNDCSQLWLVVTNRGATALTGLRGELRSLTEGVVVTRAESDYPNLAPNAHGSNATPFQIRTDPSFPCGGGAQFELVLTASNFPPTAILYTFLSSAGHALSFDGSGNYVAVPHTSGLNAFPFTVTAWVKTSQATGVQGLVGKYLNSSLNGWSVFLSSGRARAWYFRDSENSVWGGGDGLDGGFIADGEWHHVAFTVNSSSFGFSGGRLYVDGVLIDSQAWSEPRGGSQPGPPTTTQELRLGSYAGGGSAFNGLLDEVAIWGAALGQAQVQTNMHRGLTGTEPGLVAYYRCDERGAATVSDSAPVSGNNNGASVGTPLFVTSTVTPFTAAGGPDCNSGGGACESCLVVAGQFDTNALESVRRLTATGLPSVCDPIKPCPGFEQLPDAPVRHQLHHFTNNTPEELCVSAQLLPGCAMPANSLSAAAYLGEFLVNQPCSNYLGDDGAVGPPHPAFSFRVPPRTNFVLVVTARTTNDICGIYALELFGLPCPPPTLHIARDTTPNKVLLHWSSAYPDYRLQSVNSLNGPGPHPFTNIPTPPVLTGGKFAVTNAATAPRQFFWLFKP